MEFSVGDGKIGERVGVDSGAVQPDAPMEVGAGGSSGGTDFADGLSLFDELILSDGSFGKVEIHGIQSNAMIEDHAFSCKKMIDNEPDHAGIHGGDGCPAWSGNVFTAMRIFGLPIDNASAAKPAGNSAMSRFDKGPFP